MNLSDSYLSLSQIWELQNSYKPKKDLRIYRYYRRRKFGDMFWLSKKGKMEVKGNKNTLNARTKKILFNFTTSTPLSVKTIVNQFKTCGIVFRGIFCSFLRQGKFLGSRALQ